MGIGWKDGPLSKQARKNNSQSQESATDSLKNIEDYV